MKLKITITANLKIVDFLDITLDLTLGTYRPYSKPNDKPLYVNKQSNHPPNVTKNILAGITKRISDNSSNKEIFDEAAPKYQKVINEAGYDYTFKYEPPET